MSGCRPFSDVEISDILNVLSCQRDKALFLLGLKSGFRISELLSLKVDDVYQYGKIVDLVSVSRKYMKSRMAGRSVRLHQAAKAALLCLVQQEGLQGHHYLFQSRKGANAPLSRVQAWRTIKAAAETLKLHGKIGTHSMRKSFATRIYDRLDRDLVKTQKAMGHRNITSTVSYLSFRQEEIDDAILAI